MYTPDVHPQGCTFPLQETEHKEVADTSTLLNLYELKREHIERANARPSTPTKIPSPRRKKPAALPQDFRPTEDHKILAAKLGVDLVGELVRFQAYFEDGQLKADWARAFKNWLIRARPTKKPQKPAARRYLTDDEIDGRIQ
jgi:hypothetical protein